MNPSLAQPWSVKVLAAVCAALAFSLVGLGPAAGSPPAGTVYSEAYFRSIDGTVLHADVLRPADLPAGARTPVLLTVTPYNGHGHDPTGSALKPPPPESPSLPYALTIAEKIDAFRRGYSLVIVDVRGFGASGGCWDNGGQGEQGDVFAAVRWAAMQPWSTGKVGVLGMSYEGTTAAEALATDPPGLAAVAALSPVVSAYLDSYTNGVPRWYDAVNAPYYNATHYFPPSVYDNSQYLQNWLVAKGTNCVGAQAGSAVSPNANLPYWQQRDLAGRASRTDVPVFGSQGFLDTNVAPDNLPTLYPQLRDPRGLWLGQYAHYSPVTDDQVGRSAAAQLAAFLDETLLGRSAASSYPNVIVQEAPDLRWRAERAWPPPDARYYPIRLRPGGYLDTADNAAGDSVLVPPAPAIPAQDFPFKGQGTWTFTQPLPYEIHLAGTPRLQVRATGPATARLIALLYDVAPNGDALMICRGATLLADGNVGFALYPQDWRLPAGHRLGILLSGADVSEWIPEPGSGSQVQIRSGSVEIPALRYGRDRFLDGGPGISWSQIKHPVRIDPATIATDAVHAQLPPPLTSRTQADRRHRVKSRATAATRNPY
jgi:predicted acyl esterase